MAYSKTPTESTYQTKEVKLIQSPSNRNAAGQKDTISLNGFYDIIRDQETKDEDFWWVKRDGTVAYPYALENSNVRGTHYWNQQDKLLVAYEDKIAIITGATGVLSSEVTPFTTTSGDVGFTEFYYEDGSTKICVSDGTTLITIDSADTVVESVDEDLPTPHDPHILFLDGYIFLVKTDTADIYNSDLDDPLAWTPGDFISAELLPDQLIRIARLNNYLIAFGNDSIEYFFNAGNASGSPLQRNDTPVKQVGYLGGFAAHGNKIFFVGNAAQTGPEVFMLEDFKMEELKSPPLRRYLQNNQNFFGSIVSNGGHDFYVLSTGDITYVMDLATKIWYRWAFQDETVFPIRWAVAVPLTGQGYVSVFGMGDREGLFYFDPDIYQDVGENFEVKLQTNKNTFGNLHEKFMSRLVVYADRTAGNLLVSWSDDDYTTWATERSISLNKDRPMTHRLGRFVDRAFRARYIQNTPLRLRTFEVDYNLGAK